MGFSHVSGAAAESESSEDGDAEVEGRDKRSKTEKKRLKREKERMGTTDCLIQEDRSSQPAPLLSSFESQSDAC